MPSKRLYPCRFVYGFHGQKCSCKSLADAVGFPRKPARRRPTDTERLTAILKLGLVEYYPVGVVTTRREIDCLMREEAKRAR